MEEAAQNILTPVLEAAIMLASKYATACGRSAVTAKDVSLGLMYATRNVTGRHIGSLLDSDEDSDSGEDIEEVDETEEPFTEYTGDDDLLVSMNECARTWDEWQPETPVEQALKNAVNKACT